MGRHRQQPTARVSLSRKHAFQAHLRTFAYKQALTSENMNFMRADLRAAGSSGIKPFSPHKHTFLIALFRNSQFLSAQPGVGKHSSSNDSLITKHLSISNTAALISRCKPPIPSMNHNSYVSRAHKCMHMHLLL